MLARGAVAVGLLALVACGGSAGSSPAAARGDGGASNDGPPATTDAGSAASLDAGGAADVGAQAEGAGPDAMAVAPCSAPTSIGTWESITPPGVTEADAIVADPFVAGTVWLGTNNTGLFKSTDCAATWTHVNTGANGAMLDLGAMESMQLDPVHPGVIYAPAWNGSEGLWKSTNGGVDWTQLFPAGSEVASVVTAVQTSSVAMDAHDPMHLVVCMHASCSAPYGLICEAESTDGGDTWTITTVPIPDTCGEGFCPGAGAFILSATSWLFGTYSDGLWLTTDRGAAGSWTNVVPAGAYGATGGKVLDQPFAPSPTGAFYLASEQGILTSADGTTWSLIPSSGGSAVGLAMGDGRVWVSDQWTLSYHSASFATPTVWTSLAAPPAPSYMGFTQGGEYLQYDEAHHILYSSNWNGGAWRMVMQ